MTIRAGACDPPQATLGTLLPFACSFVNGSCCQKPLFNALPTSISEQHELPTEQTGLFIHPERTAHRFERTKVKQAVSNDLHEASGTG